MASPASNPFSFLSGYAQDRNTVRVIAQVDEIKAAGSTASRLMKWTRADGKWSSFRLQWHATRMCMLQEPEIQLLAVGPAGIVSVGTISGNSEEEIDASDDGPKRLGDVRDLRRIGGHAYTAGMSRQVYRREAPGRWTRQDQGVVQPRGTLDLAGFNAVDGLKEADIYAVGFGGEIWRRKEDQWQQMESPTNLVLHRVRVVAEDLIFASGQMGVLLRYSGSGWETIDHDATEDDLWGMEWYKDRLYVACDSGIFVLTDDSLTRLDLGLSEDVTCRHLHQADGVMCSFGPKHVIWTEDGAVWHDVTP